MFIMQTEWVEHGTKDHEVPNDNNIYMEFRLGETPMWHIKLPSSKGGSLLRSEVGWDRVAFWLQRCQWLLLMEFVGSRT